MAEADQLTSKLRTIASQVDSDVSAALKPRRRGGG